VPSESNDPLFDSLQAENLALQLALAEAEKLLAMVNADANNIQLDIMRWRRRNHKVVHDA
jgi:hypothetical protein